jgi:hypothetical protein
VLPAGLYIQSKSLPPTPSNISDVIWGENMKSGKRKEENVKKKGEKTKVEGKIKVKRLKQGKKGQK